MLDKEATTEEWLRGHAPIGSGASLPDGTEVGRWRIVAFIARGGSGEVYRAVEVDGQRMAALKILHRTDAAAVARFAREVQVLSELRDRAFPVFFESGTFGGRPWYATEFLQPLDMPATDRAVARFIVAVCRGAGAIGSTAASGTGDSTVSAGVAGAFVSPTNHGGSAHAPSPHSSSADTAAAWAANRAANRMADRIVRLESILVLSEGLRRILRLCFP